MSFRDQEVKLKHYDIFIENEGNLTSRSLQNI